MAEFSDCYKRVEPPPRMKRPRSLPVFGVVEDSITRRPVYLTLHASQNGILVHMHAMALPAQELALYPLFNLYG